MRLIDADEAMKRCKKSVISDFLAECQTVDPVIHGHWINRGCGYLECSVCNDVINRYDCYDDGPNFYDYCPYCGAQNGWGNE